jgi:dihydrofolate reductase
MSASLIAAISANGVIGRDGGLPWHLPADLRRFKALTLGHHLIVGRTTWESIGRPLPGRKMVVVTRKGLDEAESLRTAESVAEAVRLATSAGDAEPFVAGGAGVYREALDNDLVDRLYLTSIHREYEGETGFPGYDESRWQLVSSSAHPADRDADLPAFDFLVFDRRRSPD